MKTNSFRIAVLLLVGVSSALTSCVYPYNNGYYGSRYGYGGFGSGPNQQAGTLYGAAGGAVLGSLVNRRHPVQGALIGGVLGGLAGNAIGASRDRYYYVNRNPYYGRSYYSRPNYSSYRSPYSTSYYSHPYFSNSSFYSPFYSRNSCYTGGYNYRPWGGGFGFGQPSGWGSGFGIGSRWY